MQNLVKNKDLTNFTANNFNIRIKCQDKNNYEISLNKKAVL